MLKVCPSMRTHRRSGLHSHQRTSPHLIKGFRFSSHSSYGNEGLKKNVFIQSSTGNNRISSLFQGISNVVQRIFRAETYITTNWKDTGLIAADQMYRFSESLKTPDKKSISLTSNAFYVPIETRSTSGDITIPGSYYMPSILFEGAKENDVIGYYLKNRKIELTLKQQSHPHENGRQNFETFFASLKSSFLTNLQKPRDPMFLFLQDIPPETPCLGFRALDSACTYVYSADTKRWEFFKFSDLELFKNSVKNSAQFEVIQASSQENSSTFFLGVAGLKKEDLKILVDRNYLALIGKRTFDLNCEEIEGFHRIPTQLSLQLTEHRMIDHEKTTLRIRPNGIAELTVTFKREL